MNASLQTTLKIIDEISKEVSKAPKKLQDEGLLEFVQEFYKFTPSGDLENKNPKKLSTAAISLFEFIRQKPQKDPKIRIYNPTKDIYGWDSAYTYIDILNSDIPFLVDSLSEELKRMDLKIRRLYHPVVATERDNKGNLQNLYTLKSDPKGKAESVIQFQIAKKNESQIEEIKANLEKILLSVKIAVDDWGNILRKVNYVVTEISASAGYLSSSYSNTQKNQINDNALEIKEFLEWLKDGNFVFLGYTEYHRGKKGQPELLKESSLGILKIEDPLLTPRDWDIVDGNPLLGKNRQLIDITKANRKSQVHRPVHMDYIGIKRLNEKGEVIGEHKFLGLFTSSVYYQSAKNIPIIRKKIESIHEKSGFAELGHSSKALSAILEDFPRDELLQSSENDLFETALGIVLLNVQPKVRLFVRKDEFERFLSCIIFIPKENMSTALRLKMEDILTKAFNGNVANHYTQVTESHLARLQIIIKTTPGSIPEYDEKELEKQLASAARRWTDELHEFLCNRFGEDKGEEFFDNYKEAFSVSYQNRFSVQDAYYDILQIEKIIGGKHVSFDIYESLEGTEDIFEFKIYTNNKQIRLSHIMPILENMGLSTLDEHTYVAKPLSTTIQGVWIHRFRFIVIGVKKPKLSEIKDNFEQAIFKTWEGHIQNDALNKLILLANLKWRDVTMVRAYCKFLQQSRFAYSQAYIQSALCNHPKLTAKLVNLFYSRFDPEYGANRQAAETSIQGEIESILSTVSDLAEDRVIRGVYELISATLRTNFFQKNGENAYKDYISFKLSSAKISWLPAPKPFVEIFVYSSRVEGVHLRGGKVARGGLRWSDRTEDFRTEVLGLMKAQMTKNSVIIPVGSKGGFVVKQAPETGGREAFMAEGIECYKTFLRGLLDVTDNLVGGKIQPPKDVVRHDQDDAYLVVAADKGTATFSDIANSVSAEYNFWLGDAFASGGSVGYDHKKMGITARGAWISVERHFKEAGVNINKDDFTVIGIGDMAGDVFGNGMLCSQHIKLVGAFNHMHIFLDPNPDAAISYKERERLFRLPRSTWADYNSGLISKGGGIFERSAKNIKLSKEIMMLLDIEQQSVTPDELIKHMLKAQVGLIWNGGIGTYIKSRSESNEAVGDKTNDNLRINGEDIRAKVVGEGGNLGFTQLGRIEYAKKGGRINTDAIDNSAGVDCSDHEVNIKIALSKAVEDKKLTIANRNKLLESMTEEVAELVLSDNRLQTQALTIAQLQGSSSLEVMGRLISSLERNGYLNRAIEFLPTEEEILRRSTENKGLTRPELSVVLAYSKIVLYAELLASNLPDDSYYEEDLVRYFPEKLQNKYLAEIKQHPLRREIIATSVTNSILNRIGSASFFHIQEDTGVSACDIARAYTITRDVFELRDLWDDISAVENITSEQQKELFLEVQNVVERSTLWFLRNYPQPLKVNDAIKDFAPGVGDLFACLAKIMPKPLQEIYDIRLNRYIDYGLSKKLANKLAGLEALVSACDIVEVARKSNLEVAIVGKLYFELGSRLNFNWIRRALSRMPSHSYWEKLSHKSLTEEIYGEQKRLTSRAVKHLSKDNSCLDAANEWEEKNIKQVRRYNDFLKDLKVHEEPELSMIIIAIRKIQEISAN
jgi:glutamate dehydrogenase